VNTVPDRPWEASDGGLVQVVDPEEAQSSADPRDARPGTQPAHSSDQPPTAALPIAENPDVTDLPPDPLPPADLPPADRQVIESLPAASALLLLTSGPGTAQRFLLDADSITVGRHAQADVFLDDVTVSRRHGEFIRQGGRFVVRDGGSLNGTYVNHLRIDQAVLSDGDEVQIGRFKLTFHASPHDR